MFCYPLLLYCSTFFFITLDNIRVRFNEMIIGSKKLAAKCQMSVNFTFEFMVIVLIISIVDNEKKIIGDLC